MLGWICEKMATQESAQGGDKFFISNPTGLCVVGEDCLIAVGNGSWDNTRTFDPSNKGERLGEEPNTLVQHAQYTGGSSNG
jgi:hypothetical protein